MLVQVPRRKRESFAITRCQLSFHSSACHSAWRDEQAEVTLSLPSHPGALPARSTAVVLGRGYLFTLATYSAGDLKDAFVSMEVVFTSLPTCNILHAFAHTGPVPCAPASAEEPSAHQARSVRDALERSFKTGTSFDIIFQAYTRRLSTGKAARPSPIYASTTVLQATAPLPDFFEEGFTFSSLFELPEGGTPPFISPESCEYESDSDLDDEESDNMTGVQLAEKSVIGDVASESASHDQQSHSPALHDTQAQEDAIDNGSILSLSSFEAFQERSTTQTSLSEEAETVTVQNVKSGSRVILVKGVAWKTYA
ncbi:hypothetical protein M405DRAFT_937014 [Rhizopogon salebrosus TDB-379]|nr:hypothetical protein M405DRAFT_937014 [Rhizopogon salebrosus TDB-379]